jgi:hypothetical protein
MPQEVGAAALLSLLPRVVCVGMSHHKATVDKECLVNVLTNIPSASIDVLLIGTYWSEAAMRKAEDHSACRCVTAIKPDEFGTLNSVFGFIRHSLYWTSAFDTLVTETHRKFVELLTDHELGRNVNEAQALISGLENYHVFENSMSLFDRMLACVTTPIELVDIIAQGRTLMMLSAATTQKRALRNSTVVLTESGKRIAVTMGGEFINQTHQALSAKHSADATIVLSLKFSPNSGTVQLAYSVRAQNDTMSAFEIVKQLPVADTAHGDGTARAAGGSVPIEIKLNFK